MPGLGPRSIVHAHRGTLGMRLDREARPLRDRTSEGLDGSFDSREDRILRPGAKPFRPLSRSRLPASAA